MAAKHIISTFLKDKRKNLGLTQEKFADFLEIPFRTYCDYEGGERPVSQKRLDQIAQKLGATYDEMGIEFDDENLSGSRRNVIRFLKKKRFELDLTQVDFAAYLDIHFSTYKGYEYGLSNIPLPTLDKIAEKLETTTAEMVSYGEEYTEKESVTPTLTAQTYVSALSMIDPWIIFALGSASRDQVEAVRAIVKAGNITQKERDEVIRGIVNAAADIQSLGTLKQALGFMETAAKADQKVRSKKGTT